MKIILIFCLFAIAAQAQPVLVQPGISPELRRHYGLPLAQPSAPRKFPPVVLGARETFTDIDDPARFVLTNHEAIYPGSYVTGVSLSNAIVKIESGRIKVPLVELPEPIRSKYYDPARIEYERDKEARRVAEKLQITTERNQKRKAEAEAILAEKISRSRPYRVIDGHLYDLTRYFADFHTKPQETRLNYSGFMVGGTVLNVTEDGLLISSAPGNFFLRNFGTEQEVYDGKGIATFAILVGRHRYPTITGTVATVPLYDCGETYDRAKHGTFEKAQLIMPSGTQRSQTVDAPAIARQKQNSI